MQACAGFAVARSALWQQPLGRFVCRRFHF